MICMRRLAIVALLSLLALPALAQSTGRISGRVTGSQGQPLGGVVVVASDTNAAAVTSSDGRYILRSVPPGTHTLYLTAGEETDVIEGVVVRAGETTTLDRQLDWELSFAETITVYSASRGEERLVEAPAAVNVVSEEEILLNSPTGQLPKVLEFGTGVDFSQSGLYDINFNTRGFNSSLNRRILTLIDGRDPSVPFLGAQEWAAVSFPMDLMQSVELVRGPGSALYGANAFNGVLNMVTSSPRYDQGGKLTLTGGELGTARVDLHHAGELGGDWFYRVVGGYQQSDDFTRSRNAGVEYGNTVGGVGPEPVPCTPATRPGTFNCLPFEARPLAMTENEIMYGGLRFDRYFQDSVLTLEAGDAVLEGPTFQTGIGRVQVTDVDRPWARANFNTEHWNILGYWDARKADEQVALASGALLYEDSSNIHGEIQGNQTFYQGRGRIVGGVAYTEEKVDTANPQGFQTLMMEARNEDMQAVFGQLDFDLTDSLKVVVAGRWDDSSLHDAQVSPKASLVYALTPNQTVRATYNEAFQVPNYSEFFLRAPAGAPITGLSALEEALGPLLGGVSLGFDFIPILALGNPALDVEEITSYEIGYAGIYANRLFLTVDYYQNNVQNFVTDLLPGVNPQFAPYQPPPGLQPQVRAILLQQLQAALGGAFRGMTNLQDGSPAIVLSYTNAGEVDTEGLEIGVNWYVNENWLVETSGSWFDFEVVRAAPDLLLPNAPEYKATLGLTYRADRFDASIKARWVDDFVWATGIYFGEVPSYTVVNLAGNYRLSDDVAVGLNVSNLEDSNHWESFGGDRLARRALGFVSYSW